MKKDEPFAIINDEYFTLRYAGDLDGMKYIGKFFTSILLKFPDSRFYGKVIRIPLEKFLLKVAPSFWESNEDDIRDDDIINYIKTQDSSCKVLD